MDTVVTGDKKQLANDLVAHDLLLNMEDSDNDSDYTPECGEGSVTSDDDGDDDTESPASPKMAAELPLVISKRKLDVLVDENPSPKKTKVETEKDAERRTRVDTIWAGMNQKDDHGKKQTILTAEKAKQPLDDVSASLNQTRPPPHLCAERNPKTSPGIIVALPRKKAEIVRPASMLSALVSQYKIKVPKVNTLEKSRADWQGFVDREGIREDLKYKNKDGYMEKVAFMQRVDDRRLTHLKSGGKASNR